MAKFHSPNAGSGAANSGGGADSGKIRAAHLLVKHNQSRRPMSWKEVRDLGRERETVLPSLGCDHGCVRMRRGATGRVAVSLAESSGLTPVPGDELTELVATAANKFARPSCGTIASLGWHKKGHAAQACEKED